MKLLLKFSNLQIINKLKDKLSLNEFSLKLSFFLIIISLLLQFCSSINNKKQSNEHLKSISQSSLLNDEYSKKNRGQISYVVKSVSTFKQIISKFATSDYVIEKYDTSFQSIGLSTLFPNDSIVFSIDSNKTIVMCSILSNLDSWYHVYLIDSIMYAEKRPLNVTKYQCIAKGVVKTSFHDEMYKLGIGITLVTKFMDIFARDINFNTFPQENDTFEILFEKKYCNGNFIGYGSILAAKYTNRKKTYYAIGMEDEKSSLNYFDLEGRSIRIKFLKTPVKYIKITSGFSYSRRHPVHGVYRPHFGVDFAADIGTPIYATANGTVRFAGFKGEFGNFVCISHGASIQTFYGHLNSIGSNIRVNSKVKKGQIIGTLGNSGISTGPHLCYRIKMGSRYIDPLTLTIPTISTVQKKDIDRFEYLKHEYLYAMGSRFFANGCFVLDMTHVQSETEITIKTTSFLKENNDYFTSS